MHPVESRLKYALKAEAEGDHVKASKWLEKAIEVETKLRAEGAKLDDRGILDIPEIRMSR